MPKNQLFSVPPIFSMATPARDVEELHALPTLGHGVSEKTSVREADTNSVDLTKEKDFGSSVEVHPDDEDVVYLKGEPIVTTGRDVSRFVVDIRDDGDSALTFRSFFLGTVMAGLGAALCQVRSYSTIIVLILEGVLITSYWVTDLSV